MLEIDMLLVHILLVVIVTVVVHNVSRSWYCSQKKTFIQKICLHLRQRLSLSYANSMQDITSFTLGSFQPPHNPSPPLFSHANQFSYGVASCHL